MRGIASEARSAAPLTRSVRAKSRTAFERSENTAFDNKKKGLDFARQRFSTSLEPNGWWVSAVVALLIAGTPSSALAQSTMPPAAYADTPLADPRKEAEAKALMDTLRCIVCQGQAIGDSNADMAGDMRALVRRRIEAGEKPEDIRAWLIQRYGAWVSYQPPVEPVTWPLWAAPVVLLLAGLFLARGRFRKRKAG
jgi:cytochrome c-type biogenesis protein CcmH